MESGRDCQPNMGTSLSRQSPCPFSNCFKALKASWPTCSKSSTLMGSGSFGVSKRFAGSKEMAFCVLKAESKKGARMLRPQSCCFRRVLFSGHCCSFKDKRSFEPFTASLPSCYFFLDFLATFFLGAFLVRFVLKGLA